MTSAGRLSFAAHLRLPPSGYVCLKCQLRASAAVRTTNPSITLPYASRRDASWIDTDKLRKKIWGTETPPGQEDPYGKESVFDQKRREREQERQKSRELQPRPEQAAEKPEDETDDVEATTTEGLETVGGPDWEKEEREAEDDSFEGFMDPQRVEGRAETILTVHRALVETYALKEAGLPLVMDYYSIGPTKDYAEQVAGGAKFEQNANGEMTLVLESEGLRQSILDCVTPQDLSKDKNKIEDTENLATIMPASDTWRNVSLDDAAIKFAVLKRVMQLTGKRIPDPDIAAITTPKSVLVHLVKKPKPTKIAEALLKSNIVADLPNVQILDKRFGLMDREIEVGRWKVIKEELEKRGLPVIGGRSVHNALRDGEQ